MKESDIQLSSEGEIKYNAVDAPGCARGTRDHRSRWSHPARLYSVYGFDGDMALCESCNVITGEICKEKILLANLAPLGPVIPIAPHFKITRTTSHTGPLVAATEFSTEEKLREIQNRLDLIKSVHAGAAMTIMVEVTTFFLGLLEEMRNLPGPAGDAGQIFYTKTVDDLHKVIMAVPVNSE